jgi:hypothetical protein
MATSSGNYHLEPTYKQHTAVDDKAGVLIDVDLTTGEIMNEGTKLVEVIKRIEIITDKTIKHVTADKGYAHYLALLPTGHRNV